MMATPTQAPPAGQSLQNRSVAGRGNSAVIPSATTESWIEVSSQPSSSSVSSAGEDIITTGLRVGSSPQAARRRRLYSQSSSRPQNQAHGVAQQATSSQDEYEESETDSDHVLNSSAENITSFVVAAPTPLRNVQQAAVDSSDDDDNDESSTALAACPPSTSFRPQPNAFTHPPSHLQHRHSANSAVLNPYSRPSFAQHSSTRVDRGGPSFMSPHTQADNDAALRASLTTLLSCAAAARSRGKTGDAAVEGDASSGAQPVNLRLVPESELVQDETSRPVPSSTRRIESQQVQSRPRTQPRLSPSSPSSPSSPRNTNGSSERTRRANTPPTGKPRSTKKKKTSPVSPDESAVSSSVLTWGVVGTGLAVLVSGFILGAGIAIGRDLGRQEALNQLGISENANLLAADGGNCSRDVIRSSSGTLRRFRWGTGMGIGGSVVA